MLTSLLLGLALPQTIHYKIDCTLLPTAGEMRLEVSATVPRSLVKNGAIQFRLGELMQPPVVHLNGAPADAKFKNTLNLLSYWDVSVPAGSSPLEFKFSYTNKAKQGFVYYLGPEACYAGGYNTLWYPRIDEMRATGSISITAPKEFVSKATGKELGRDESGATATTRFSVEQPSVLTFASAPYHVTRIDGKLPITVYSLQKRTTARQYAEGCNKVLAVLEREFGDYPYPDFSIIETPQAQSEAGGFSGASFEGFMFASSRSLDDDFNVAYFGHEMGHQWWGNYVQRSGEKGRYMLDEAMAQYGSLQCVETIDGPELASRYRRIGYPGYSVRQNGYWALLYGPTGLDMPLDNLPTNYDNVYHNLANAKGFLVYDTIARHIGRDKFRRAIHSFVKKHAWGGGAFDEFLANISNAAGKDGPKLVEQWFSRSGAPVLSLSYKVVAGRVDGVLEQTSPAYLLKVPVEIRFADGTSKRLLVRTESERQEFNLPATKRVAGVSLDPHYEVFHSTAELQKEVEALKFYSHGQLLSLRSNLPAARAALEEGLERWPVPDIYASEFLVRYALGGVLRREGKLDEAKAQYEAALKAPTRRAADLPWLYLRMAQIAQAQKDGDRIRWAVGHMRSAEAALPYATGALGEAKRQGL